MTDHVCDSGPLARPPVASWLPGRRWLFAALLLSVSLPGLALPGCAGYRFGNGTLYRPDIRTVYVPMFQSNALRRYWSEMLTEAVVKEIELKTPFKVVTDPAADSTLIGRVIDIRKRVLAEDANDLPRNLELDLAVEVQWRDRGGQLIVRPVDVPLPGFMLVVSQASDFVPEAGQTVATSQSEAIAKLAAQIVSQMEMQW
ncbi:MAG: LptE family protein [Pirellulaceae bacterium]|nr:LptE family protein [Pirellulaceae bacterium]